MGGRRGKRHAPDSAPPPTNIVSEPATNPATEPSTDPPTTLPPPTNPSPSGTPTTTTTTQPPTTAVPTRIPRGPPIKRQKRDEYKAATAEESTMMPKKKWFRQRAHANPFSDHALAYPTSPGTMDWSPYYPAFTVPRTPEQEQRSEPPALTKPVEIADIGCGFGGLLFALAPKMPDTLMLGLEIRTSVTEFVQNKIRALRQQQLSLTSIPPTATLAESTIPDDTDPPSHPHENSPNAPPKEPIHPIPGVYNNIAALRANTMKFLPNFFPKSSLSKIFLCFPDPHFKARKHKARIVSSTLTSEYAYVLKEGGLVYTITDVEDLGKWMWERFGGSVQFEEVGEEERESDVCVRTMRTETEEGRKVDRNGGRKFVSVWRRVGDPGWPGETGE